jgi:B9 domain-containing protein 2
MGFMNKFTSSSKKKKNGDADSDGSDDEDDNKKSPKSPKKKGGLFGKALSFGKKKGDEEEDSEDEDKDKERKGRKGRKGKEEVKDGSSGSEDEDEDEDEENRDGNAESRGRKGKKGKKGKKGRSSRDEEGEGDDDEEQGGGGGAQNKEYMRRQPMEKLEARLRERVRVVAQMTPEVHFIGELVGGSNFNGKGVSCKFTIEFGKNWDLLSGEILGQTQYGNADPDDLTSWNHPIDLHMSTSTMQGWPRIRLQVWELDEYGRTNMAGYGFCHLPTNAGNYEIGVPCWRPTGSIPEEIQSFFLGANTQLTDESVLYSKAWENRCRLVTVPSGKIWLNVSVVHRFFAQQSVDLPTGNF